MRYLLLIILFFCVMLNGCVYESYERGSLNIESAICTADSVLLTLTYQKYNPPNELGQFPDGGMPHVTFRTRDLLKWDLKENKFTQLNKIPLSVTKGGFPEFGRAHEDLNLATPNILRIYPLFNNVYFIEYKSDDNIFRYVYDERTESLSNVPVINGDYYAGKILLYEFANDRYQIQEQDLSIYNSMLFLSSSRISYGQSSQLMNDIMERYHFNQSHEYVLFPFGEKTFSFDLQTQELMNVDRKMFIQLALEIGYFKVSEFGRPVLNYGPGYQTAKSIIGWYCLESFNGDNQFTKPQTRITISEQKLRETNSSLFYLKLLNNRYLMSFYSLNYPAPRG